VEVKRENKAKAAGTAEDEVVREIVVFLSPELAQQIYLVQYPLQHDDVTTPVSARIKPRHGMLQEDHAIPEVPIEQDGNVCHGQTSVRQPNDPNLDSYVHRQAPTAAIGHKRRE